MLEVTDEVKQLYQTDSIEKTLTINFYSAGTYKIHPTPSLYPSNALYPASRGTPVLILSDENVLTETMTITEGLFSGDVIDFRSCYSSKCSITLLGVEDDVYGYDMEIIQHIGGETVPLFTGIVDTAPQRNSQTKVTAYDYLYYNYDEDMSEWYNTLEFPMTAKDFRLALYDVCNIPYADVELVNDEMLLQKAELNGEITGRTLLALIGEFNGVFVHVNRKNELTYIMLQNLSYIYPSKTLYPRAIFPGIQTSVKTVEKIKWYFTCEHERYKTKEIDKVILQGDMQMTSGDGKNPYVVKDNLLFECMEESARQIALDNLYLVIRGLPYVPHKTEIQGRPYVEVGDIVNIKTNKTAFDTYVFRRTLKGAKALRDTYEAEGEEYHNTAYAI